MKNRTSLFDQSNIIVKIGKKTYEFDASESLDLSKNLKTALECHTNEYYHWRKLRDKVRAWLRAKKLAFEHIYNTRFFEASVHLEQSSYTISNLMVKGYIERYDNIKTLRKEIRSLEDRLDKLDTIIYALEHRKQMLYLIMNSL